VQRCTKEELEEAGLKTLLESDVIRAEKACEFSWKIPWVWNPKVKGSGIIECIPQTGECPNKCEDCFFQSGRSYLAPLGEHLPHIPTAEMAQGRIVRVNDGNDSNVDRPLVEAVAIKFEDFFFNTAIPERLGDFPGPVVLTVNPGTMTDRDFHKIPQAPPNMMFARVRTNMWNLYTVVKPAVQHYAVDLGVPVVLTFMAYYASKVHEGSENDYEWRTRTINPYWVIKRERVDSIERVFSDKDNVYLCGRHGSSKCSACGNCLREYYNAKERMREAKESSQRKGDAS